MIPTVNLTVISFYEAPWEPKYVNKIWSKVNEIGGKCFLWSDIKDKDETFWQNLFIDIIFIGTIFQLLERYFSYETKFKQQRRAESRLVV